jgi:hypothetical protein
MPPFILHIFSVIIAITTAETYRNHLVEKPDEEDSALRKRLYMLQFLARLFCAVLNIVNFLAFLQ